MPPRKEVYSYEAPWHIHGLDWCNRPSHYFRMAISSFIEDKTNKLQVIDLDEQSDCLKVIGETNHMFPASKLMWAPAKNSEKMDFFATSGDSLKIWEYQDNYGIVPRAILTAPKTQEHAAPLTSLDWNTFNPSIIATSSVDTTCTIWNIEVQQPSTQLIAHDSEVYDVAFANSLDVFGTVGADGSVRMFDLRNLEHSTIIYETSDASPLVRLMWNKKDANYLAVIKVQSDVVYILDTRMPCVPVTELKGHKQAVNHCAWSPVNAHQICTTGEDGQALVWNITDMRKSHQEPSLAYHVENDIGEISWNPTSPEWVAIGFQNNVQALRI